MPEELRAERIVIVDSKGNPKIVLEGETPSGGCMIAIGNPKGGVQIDANPDTGFTGIALSGGFFGAVTITKEGITIRSKDKSLGVTIGRILNEDLDEIVIYQNGSPVWRTHCGDKAQTPISPTTEGKNGGHSSPQSAPA